jgi:hypothetical protein
MRLVVVSFKECWQDEAGRWLSSGGFPLQIGAISSIFDEMTLITVGGKPGTGGIPLPEHARVVPLRQPQGDNIRRKLSVLLNLPYYLYHLARHLRQADAVHVPLPGDLPFLGMCCAQVFGKPLIARYGGSWVATSQTTIMNRVTKAWLRIFAGGRNVMLATGEGEKPPGQGMHWIFVTALARAELAQSRPVLNRGLSTPPRLVYIGRLSPEKGVAFLIKALAILKNQEFSPLPQVTLVGNGPERAFLEAVVKDLGCEGIVTFAGQVNRTGLERYIGSADLCVQPSLTEGYSKAWLDAMAYGLPVLTSSVGAASAIIGKAGERGWLVPPGDAMALANTLRIVLAGPIEWPALRQKCRAYAESRTLEAWSQEIGHLCARQWNMSLVEGKLCK